MSISTKGKRKLICQNKTHYWYVASDWESDRRGDMLMLHITAADRSLIRKVPLRSSLREGEPQDMPFAAPDTVTPEIVRQIIEADQANLNKELK